MKPGMQREILIAFWLLFDEFEIGGDDGAPGQDRTEQVNALEKQREGTATRKREPGS